MTRRPIVAANWKMNKTQAEASSYAVEFRRLVAQERKVDVVIVPPFPFLVDLIKKFSDCPVAIGAQNCSEHESGAYTGETSAVALADLGCSYVVLGHSERRHVFGESDSRIAAKVTRAQQSGLVPILCVGETLAQREANQTLNVVEHQLTAGLKNVPRSAVASVVIAYEPVWAIGTGKTASPAQAQDVHHAIRNMLATTFGNTAAQAIRIQYGGSVKPNNVKELMAQPDVDGGLVGGASLQPGSFAEIVHFYRD